MENLKAQWHPTLNGEVRFEDVKPTSHKVYWWVCEYGHPFPAAMRNRVGGSKCTVCSGKRVLTGVTDLGTVEPDVSVEWDYEANDGLTPQDVTPGSNKVVGWVCQIDGTKYRAAVYDRTRKDGKASGCPACAGKIVIVGKTDLPTTHPAVAAEFHPTLNGDLRVEQLSAGSEKKVWWLGKTCGHAWPAIAYNRTNPEHPTGCPVCAGRSIIVGETDLGTLYPKVAAEIHPTLNGGITAQQLTPGSGKMIWFQCEFDHEPWLAAVCGRTRSDKPQGCPSCSGNRVIPGETDLVTTDPWIIPEWHPTLNGDKRPENYSRGSGEVIVWECQKAKHVWPARIYDRTGNRKTGCPKCAHGAHVSQVEALFADLFHDKKLTVETSNRTVLQGQEIDIYLPDLKIGFEFNGVYWHDESNKERNYHFDKWQKAAVQGVQLIQIWEDDWLYKPGVVKQMVLHKLGLSEQRRVHARKTTVEEITYDDAKVFLDENHIQGVVSGSHYLALTEVDGTVVAVMVLRVEQNGDHNIVRYATSANVPGGFTKLLKHVERTLQPKRIITFSDHAVSDGSLYANNGFVADKELAPDYMYVVKHRRQHKFGYRVKKFQTDPELKYVPSLTERELADLNGLRRIWDAGKTRWVKTYA